MSEIVMEGYFSRNRLKSAAKATGIVFVVGLIIFFMMELVSMRSISGSITGVAIMFANSLWMAAALAAFSFFSVILFKPREALKVTNMSPNGSSASEMVPLGPGRSAQGLFMQEEHKNVSENQEEIDKEKKEKDNLEHLRESHKPSENSS